MENQNRHLENSYHEFRTRVTNQIRNTVGLFWVWTAGPHFKPCRTPVKLRQLQTNCGNVAEKWKLKRPCHLATDAATAHSTLQQMCLTNWLNDQPWALDVLVHCAGHLINRKKFNENYSSEWYGRKKWAQIVISVGGLCPSKQHGHLKVTELSE